METATWGPVGLSRDRKKNPLLRDRGKECSVSYTLTGFHLTGRKLQNFGIFIQTYKNKTKNFRDKDTPVSHPKGQRSEAVSSFYSYWKLPTTNENSS